MGTRLDFDTLIATWLQELTERHYSSRTIKRKREAVRLFRSWAETRPLSHLLDITSSHLADYLDYLKRERTWAGLPLKEATQLLRIREIALFYRWLVKNNYLLADPTRHLRLSLSRRHLPGNILSPTEIALVMKQPEPRTVAGLRNRTMLEVLYATGVRCSELVSLRTIDLCFPDQTLFVRQGKGRKDRLVPIGDRCSQWLRRYLGDARPFLVRWTDPGFLFLTRWGGPFKPDSLTEIVHDYIRQSGITKPGACHLFRRSMATGMLENGADIRHVQEILGHAGPRTTQRYTLLSPTDLKKTHHSTHPFEKVAAKRQQ